MQDDPTSHVTLACNNIRVFFGFVFLLHSRIRRFHIIVIFNYGRILWTDDKVGCKCTFWLIYLHSTTTFTKVYLHIKKKIKFYRQKCLLFKIIITVQIYPIFLNIIKVYISIRLLLYYMCVFNLFSNLYKRTLF